MELSPRSLNHFLASLPVADLELLRPYLQPLKLLQCDVLGEVGAPLIRAFFPHSGVISLVVPLSSGETIEVASVGSDGVFGASAALSGEMALSTATVQLSGAATAIPIANLRAAAEESATLRMMLIRHEQLLFIQAQQTAACNVSHSIESRLSRWLLRMRDLSGRDAMELTQEFLAAMIGVGRNSVSLVANALQQQGLIRYSRGHIDIIDVAGLKERACECYDIVKLHSDALLNYKL